MHARLKEFRDMMQARINKTRAIYDVAIAGGRAMKTLTIELRWPPRARMISGPAWSQDEANAETNLALESQMYNLHNDPPPLLVAACAAKARAEAGRRGWQTRQREREREHLETMQPNYSRDCSKYGRDEDA